MARHDDLSTPRGTPGGPSVDPDSFGRLAERLARFLGTGRYLVAQTLIVIVWIILNVIGLTHHWDKYPFILLNLGFSTQAAYAAPLILLAQNRQADRDKYEIERDRDVNARSLAEPVRSPPSGLRSSARQIARTSSSRSSDWRR
jgi:uncharacterized membrane protein